MFSRGTSRPRTAQLRLRLLVAALGRRLGHLRSLDDLEELLDRFTPHGQTTTSIIHSAPVPRRGPPLR